MFRDSFWGLTGFEELRKIVKQGNEFCKDIGSILLERSELESAYAKSLSKLSAKLTKSSSVCIGTLADAWGLVASEMDAEAECHKQLATSLQEDICKPVKTLAETQHKSRKPIESVVDKALKSLQEKRADELKYKKLSFSSCKEREKLCDQISNAKSGKGKNTSDKDIAKLEKQLVKLEDGIRKSEKNYYDTSQKAETCREDWETAVYKACSQMQTLEEERISQMQDFMNKYNNHLSIVGPSVTRSCDKLGDAVLSIDGTSDLRRVVDQKGTGPNQPEQILPDYYAEDLRNHMSSEKRRQALQNYLINIQQDIERELKAKEGVEKLVEVYQNRPSFADADAQDDARQRLSHVGAMLNFLEATHHKVTCAMAELDHRPKPQSKYEQHIERTKDKSGQNISILRLPAAARDTYHGGDASTHRQSGDGGQPDSPFAPPPPYHASCMDNAVNDRLSSIAAGQTAGATGVSATSKPVVPKKSSAGLNRASASETARSRKSAAPPGPPRQSYFSDEDEFDNYDQAPYQVLGHCRAIYDYTGQQYDELTIKPGDIIVIYDKQEDGWWQGELNGKVGIFPATYVEDTNESHL